jgi:hypothetical protein
VTTSLTNGFHRRRAPHYTIEESTSGKLWENYDQKSQRVAYKTTEKDSIVYSVSDTNAYLLTFLKKRPSRMIRGGRRMQKTVVMDRKLDHCMLLQLHVHGQEVQRADLLPDDAENQPQTERR